MGEELEEEEQVLGSSRSSSRKQSTPVKSLPSSASAEMPGMMIRDVEGDMEKMDAELHNQGALAEDMSTGAMGEDEMVGSCGPDVELMNVEDMADAFGAFDTKVETASVREAPWSGLPMVRTNDVVFAGLVGSVM